MQTSRPPIVAVLGHVDHGKTTLLDAIRKTAVAAHEHGGITQSIGAYQSNGITFIDTPGHEAFLAMRSRGAQAADIAVLVVAANDSVMPQTVESIKIIQEAKIPFVVAINKTDLPDANVDKVIQDLLRHNVLLESYGGDVPFLKISAKTGAGVKELLDLILLLSQVNNLGSDFKGQLEAIIIESKIDKGKGPVATAIIRRGSISVGDMIFVSDVQSKVRALIDYKGQPIKAALAGTPVEILGFSKIPPVGAGISSSQAGAAPKQESKIVDSKEGLLNIILSADTQGSLEAILAKLPANVNLLQSGIGEVSEADVLLAKGSKAIILGFSVKVSPAAQKIAENEKVLVRTYKIIYELLDELADAAAGVFQTTIEEILGQGKIVAQFPFEGLLVCGVKITDGRLARGDKIRIGDKESKIKEIRVGKESVNKVEVGKECGVLLEPQVDFSPGDAIIAYS